MMLEKIKEYLYSCPTRNLSRKRMLMVSFIFVTSLLMLLQPFNLSKISSYKHIIIFGFCLISLLPVAFGIYVAPLLFPRYYAKGRYTNLRELQTNVIVFIFVAIFVWLYSSTVFGFRPTASNFILFLGDTFAIGIFPLSIIKIIEYKKTETSPLEQVQTQQIQAREGEFTIPGRREKITIHISQLLFIQSEGNYVNINYVERNSDHQSKKTIRATIKQMEEYCSGFPQIIRCHRAFLVNADNITEVEGAMQNCRLRLCNFKDEIPVGRTYYKQVKELNKV